jgi:hypothetical protein
MFPEILVLIVFVIFFIIFEFHIYFFKNFIFLFCFLIEMEFLIYLMLCKLPEELLFMRR